MNKQERERGREREIHKIRETIKKPQQIINSV